MVFHKNALPGDPKKLTMMEIFSVVRLLKKQQSIFFFFLSIFFFFLMLCKLKMGLFKKKLMQTGNYNQKI